jgi:hypothetical protein
MCRRDLARLAVFSDPFTRLSRPMSDVIGPTCVILENDDLPISRCGFGRVAHVKYRYCGGPPPDGPHLDGREAAQANRKQAVDIQAAILASMRKCNGGWRRCPGAIALGAVGRIRQLKR